jgi:hypothetical protein
MPTYSSDILPSATGIKLGSASAAFDAYIQNLTFINGGSLVLGSLALSTTGAITSTSTITGNTLVSTVATGTIPVGVTSTTKCTNLNADLLDGLDWTAPGTIGGTTPGAANFTTISASGQFTSSVITGTAPLVIASTTQVSNLNVSSLVGSTWISPGTIGSTTPNTGAFTTLTSTPVTGQTIKVGGGCSVNTSATTVSANSTSQQNLMSYSMPASLLNTSGKTLRVWMAGVYTTQAAQTPTITIDVAFGATTVASWLSTATTASQTNMPWEAVCYISTASTGATGTVEAHGLMNMRLGSAAGAGSTFQDTNTAASGAIDLTSAQTVQVHVTFSTNAAGANTCSQRQLCVELVN